jgi:hypothetical protein
MSSIMSKPDSKARCNSWTALGRPSVPEVKTITAASFSPGKLALTSTGRGVSLARASHDPVRHGSGILSRVRGSASTSAGRSRPSA